MPGLTPSYLLHGFGTSMGTSTHCQVPHRSPHRWANTGLCCPIWACLLPHPPPSSPGLHERESDFPVLGLVASASWWLLVNFTVENKKIEQLSVPSVAKCCFLLFFWKRSTGMCLISQTLLSEPSPSESFTPTVSSRKCHWGIHCDLWHLNISYQSTACYHQSAIM